MAQATNTNIMSQNKNGFIANLQYDLPASIVVFLVAMPLCLGIALASGAPLFSGIIAGIVGGIVVAMLSGSPLGVSGPAAGLALTVFTAIQDLGSFQVFLVAVVLAGVLQLIFGIIGGGVVANFFPSSVIKGMLSGIGILIFIKQIPHAFGYDADPEGDFAFQQVDGHNTFSELGYMMDQISPAAMIITGVSLFILILWERPFIKKSIVSKILPGPLLAVISGVLLGQYFIGLGGEYALTDEQLVSVPVTQSLEEMKGLVTTPEWSALSNPSIYLIAITLALVASLETLLCVEATDKLDPQKRKTPGNRELMAQGVGNIISGFIGGLPITQVIVRSSANIQSGGRTKVSAILHGVLLVVCVLAIPKYLNMIPLASLAAILLVVGYKLAKPTLFIQSFKKGWQDFIPLVITVAMIILIALLEGIFIGLAVALLIARWKNVTKADFKPSHVEGSDTAKIELMSSMNFFHKNALTKAMQKAAVGKELVIDGSKTEFVHPDIYETIEAFEDEASRKGVKVTLLKNESA